MYSRVKFKGDVGQVIQGDATFSAPCTFNQTTHVTMAAPPTDDRPLTLHQRFEVAARVDVLAALKGVPSETITRAVLGEYGVHMHIGDLPQRHYLDVIAELDAQLEEARRPVRSVRPWAAVLAASISALVASLGTALAVADEPPSHCLWQGQSYSVGAIAPMRTSDVYECTFDPSAHPAPYWAPARNLGGAGTPRT
ncbi:hypothetical protein [Ralstonia pseudosolanacearum]|uniref:hypothetical protein n=3 Tax=Ralstonia pseudosolanacearum TaxID=1310165 RepID=UPI003CF973A8